MIEDLQATFRHRFTAMARTRIAAALAATTASDHAAIALSVRELHSLAGEAGLLGFAQVVPVAREAEDGARRLSSDRTAAAADALGATLRELERLLDAL